MQTRNTGPSADLRLGVAGFTYRDLYKPHRLRELLDIFEAEVAGKNPELFSKWDEYRRNPLASRTPVEVKIGGEVFRRLVENVEWAVQVSHEQAVRPSRLFT